MQGAYVDAEGAESAATILIAEDDRRVRDSLDRYLRLEGYDNRAGSGLGLAIVHQVAEAHGGVVWANVSPLGGAAVGLRIPEIDDHP